MVCLGVAATAPGVLLGAGLAVALWEKTRPRRSGRWLMAALGAATALVSLDDILWAWPWRLLFSGALSLVFPPIATTVAAPSILHSVLVEALVGPLWLVVVQEAMALGRQSLPAQLARQHAQTVSRQMALAREPGAVTAPPPETGAVAHPPGHIRLGLDAERRRPFDLTTDEIRQGTFIVGGSGNGKTTTVIRLADGALAAGQAVVFVDAKAGDLGRAARHLAARYGVPFVTVDPDDPVSLGYNPCTGNAAAVANKIVGAFSYADAPEIYKNIAMEIVPVIVRALQAVGEPVTLAALYDALAKGALAALGRRPGAEEYRERLAELDGRSGVGHEGSVGLQRRLGALREGKFGPLFQKIPALDWETTLARSSVTYFALSATANSEDVELMARVIAQDLKLVCSRRLRAQAGVDRAEQDLLPVLAVFDEFAALKEADQLTDLLLQARQALIQMVVATQFLPETLRIRTPLLQAGVLIAHQLAAADAEAVAAEFGTHTAPESTHQVDYGTGYSEKGSVRNVEQYNVHPNDLRQLGIGVVAVRSRRSRRPAIVQVYRDPAS